MKKLLLLLTILAAVKVCSAQSGLTSSGTELAMAGDVYRPSVLDTTGSNAAYNENLTPPMFPPPAKRPCFIRIRPLCINEHLKLAPPLRVLIAIPTR